MQKTLFPSPHVNPLQLCQDSNLQPFCQKLLHSVMNKHVALPSAIPYSIHIYHCRTGAHAPYSIMACSQMKYGLSAACQSMSLACFEDNVQPVMPCTAIPHNEHVCCNHYINPHHGQFVSRYTYEIDHCTALGPCSTRHMTPNSLFQDLIINCTMLDRVAGGRRKHQTAYVPRFS